MLLAAGLAAAALLSPTRDEVPWGAVRGFAFGAAECRPRLTARESCDFVLPPAAPEPVPWSRVARWFRLDPRAVCAANGTPLESCDEQRLAPGESLILPLRRDAAVGASTPAAARAAGGKEDG
jgi:hypothetical protein